MKNMITALVLVGSTSAFGGEIRQYENVITLSAGESYSVEQVFERQGTLINGRLIIECTNTAEQKDVYQIQNPNIGIQEQGIAKNTAFATDKTLVICH